MSKNRGQAPILMRETCCQLGARFLESPLAQIAVSQVQVQARRQPASRGDAEHRQIFVVDVREVGQRLLVPHDLVADVELKISEVVSEDAPLGMVALGGLVPAPLQGRAALLPCTAQGQAHGRCDLFPRHHAPTVRRRTPRAVLSGFARWAHLRTPGSDTAAE